MFERIVVGTDGSPHSRQAIRRAAELASSQGVGEIHVVAATHVLAPHEMGRLRHELPEEFQHLVDQDFESEARLGDAEAIAAEFGVRGIGHDSQSSPAEAILAAAEECDADLIVVGARGLGPIGRFVRGSVSTKVAHHSPCDVLIVEHG
ncbi:MAG: universal stress protein [Actinomycetota bacterium]